LGVSQLSSVVGSFTLGRTVILGKFRISSGEPAAALVGGTSADLPGSGGAYFGSFATTASVIVDEIRGRPFGPTGVSSVWAELTRIFHTRTDFLIFRKAGMKKVSAWLIFVVGAGA
jgi:hypothetical protein